MSIINVISNTATVSFFGATVDSNCVNTFNEIPPTVIKTVNTNYAKVGDVLTYTITILNNMSTTLTGETLGDIIPTGSTFALGSFTWNGVSQADPIVGGNISFPMPDIASGESGVATFQVTATFA